MNNYMQLLKKNSVEMEILPDAVIITVSYSLNLRQLFEDKLKENGLFKKLKLLVTCYFCVQISSIISQLFLFNLHTW